MPTAREKLAAIRAAGQRDGLDARAKLALLRGDGEDGSAASSDGSAPARPAVPAVVQTRALDEQGLTGAEVKRRAAAGEPIANEGAPLVAATSAKRDEPQEFRLPAQGEFNERNRRRDGLHMPDALTPDERLPSVAREFGQEVKRSFDTAAASAVSGVQTSIIPSAIAGFANMTPEEQRLANHFNIVPGLGALVAMRSKGYREGAAELRGEAERTKRDDPRFDPQSRTSAAIGEFGGSVAGDLPLFILQPELGAEIPARIAARYGAGTLQKIAGYVLKQGVNVPMDVFVGAVDQYLKSGQLPSRKDLATSAGLALAARNVLGLLHARGAPESPSEPTEAPTAPARNIGPKVLATDSAAPESAPPSTEPPQVSEQRIADRRNAESAMPPVIERRTTTRRAQVASELELPEEHPAVARVLKSEESEVVPGVANRTAWNDRIRGTTQHVASVDIDNLKPVNDTFGHLAGDSLIAANGEALRIAAEEHGAHVAHISGDELRLAHDDPETLSRVVSRADEILHERGVFYEDAAGNRVQLPPEAVKGFSHGIGPNEAAAEVALNANKAERAAAGLRTSRPSGDVAVGADQGGAGSAGGSVRVGSPEEVAADVPPGPPSGETLSSEAPPEPSGPPKYAEPSAINLDRLNVDPEAKVQVLRTAQQLRPELEAARGKTLTNDEVIDAATQSEILTKATSREATKRSAAALLATRQNLAALAERGKVTREFVNSIKVVSAEATRRGRELQALAITADPHLATAQTTLVRKLIEIGKTTDEIVNAAKGVDFKDAKQVTEFYRKFVKPSLGEALDEFRYINLLSSPKTHIVNAASNLVQLAVVRPATRLASGAVDRVASTLSGSARENYIRQVPAYYKGVINSLGEASSGALRALRGNSLIERPDVAHIPTGAKFLAPFQFIPRALEASDVFFRSLVAGGEREALAAGDRIRGVAQTATRSAELAAKADKTAEYTVFRSPLDPSNATGQGKVLSAIDEVTALVQRLRQSEHALVRTPARWFVPFVQTPMNIFKQGLEYSPLGMATLHGSTNKAEQIGKALVGSTVLAGAGHLALDGRTTWSVPTNQKDRAAFYAAGLQPYSLRIGDKWVSYSKLGPLAYPIAMAAAARYYGQDAPETAGASAAQRMARIMGGIAEFFSDQSYVQGMGDLLDTVRGEAGALAKTVAGIPSQFIPLSSLLRWATQIYDPVYRKADKDLSIDAIIDNIKKGIPGLSDELPAYKAPNGKPSERPFPALNAISPVSVTEDQPREHSEFDRMQAARRQEAARRRAANEEKKARVR